MKTVLVLGGANGGWNLGDDAMFEVAAGHLRVHAGCRIVTDGPPGWTSPLADEVMAPLWQGTVTVPILRRVLRYRRYWQTDALCRCGVWPSGADALLQAYRQAMGRVRLVVFAGMGAMTDRFSAHGVLGTGMVVNLAAAAGVPVVMLGAGIGPIAGWLNRALVRRFIPRVERVFVRDTLASARALTDLGYLPERIREWVDDAFFRRPSEAEAEQARRIVGRLGGADLVVVNVHGWRRGHARRVLDTVLAEARRLWPGAHVLLLPHKLGGALDDRSFLRALLRDGGWEGVSLVDEDITAGVSRAILGQAVASVATRYHVGVLSLAAGTPAVLVCLDDTYYVQKMRGALAWYGLEDYAVRPEAVAAAMRRLAGEQARYRARVAERNVAFEAQGYLGGRYLEELLARTSLMAGPAQPYPGPA